MKKPMTMTQKILAKHANVDYVKSGQLITVNIDLVIGNEATTSLAIKEFNRLKLKEIFNKEKVVIVPDHFTPCKDIQSAQMCKFVREFVYSNNIKNYFEIGQMGIEHVLIPEKGLVVSGDLVIGADSHTCTYGALGAFSTGIGSTDMAVGMSRGKAWIKVPEAIKIILKGKMSKWVSGKDVILHIIGMIGVDGASYKSIEFVGEGIKNLSMDDRFTMANMAIEAGAKNGIFPVDEKTIEYISEKTSREIKIFEADEDAFYSEVYEIDLSKVKSTVAFPHLPENIRTIDNVGEVKIDQVVIGSCTNGRIGDLRIAASILKGKKVKDGVRLIIIPGTQKVYLQAVEEGIVKTFIESGGIFSTPTCGPCIGGHMGVLAEGEKAVSTTNRNFVGRMGHKTSEIYLASPAIAAASAIEGKIISPENII